MAEETERTPLPVATLLDELIGDQSSDLNDGDNFGHYRHVFNPETGTLHVHYEHAEEEDEDDVEPPPHDPAIYRFQLIAPVNGEPGDWARQIRRHYQDERNGGESPRSAVMRVLHAARARDASDTELGAVARVLLGIEDDD